MDFVTKVLAILFGYITLFYEVRGFNNDPKCGQNRYQKIIGGENVREAEFPWFVSIKETGRYECGGFIINQRAVLTAAHCFKHFAERVANSPNTISVALAVHYFNHKRIKRSSKFSKWEVDVKVKRIIRHPNYDASSNSGKYDIALLLLENDIEWNYGTRPVCLPTSESSNDYRAEKENITDALDFQNGEVAIVAGWPSHPHTSEEMNGAGNILQKINLRLYSNEECNRVLKEKNVTMKAAIDSSMLCAGSSEMGIDSCSGDSGSALLIQRGKVWVASYMEWIDLHNEQIDSSVFFQKFASFVPDKINEINK